MLCGPLQSRMVTWAGLEPSNDCIYVLNRHFSDTIFGMFFTGPSLDKRVNWKLKLFYFHFWIKKFQPIQRFFSYRPRRVAMSLIQTMTTLIGCEAGLRRSLSIGDALAADRLAADRQPIDDLTPEGSHYKDTWARVTKFSERCENAQNLSTECFLAIRRFCANYWQKLRAWARVSAKEFPLGGQATVSPKKGSTCVVTVHALLHPYLYEQTDKY